ncbi:MAG: glutamine-hydrolyzing carbamoyl-phosphate synthase small subunit [Actinomycetota bacterium]|nr:glutamine-hydrolyzing carbamoyl-phosphate synthase small subunit [Actinomycetota bacterium]
MTGPALLALEDGTVLRGRALGARGTSTGEVCFNTGMTGYQEILTDPSYHGQIVTMTAAHIGNTGTNVFDDQSRRPWVAGFVIHDASRLRSSWRADWDLDAYLDRHGIVSIAEVDTRRLTRHIRTVGAMRGAVSSVVHDGDELVDIARAAPSLVGRDLAREVTTENPYVWDAKVLGERSRSGFAAGVEEGAPPASPDTLWRVAAYDFGAKHNILDLLVAHGCEVTVVPAASPASEILAGDYDGVFLSNGPGDPEPVDYAVENVRSLLGRIPIFGICLGHQIMGLAVGGRTYKLPFGHRGSNHPVKQRDHDHVEITCQNHGFAVEASSIDATPAVVSHVNLNDATVEGLDIPGAAFSVQYHPESGPGPHDARYLFERFNSLMKTFEPTELTLGVTA